MQPSTARGGNACCIQGEDEKEANPPPDPTKAASPLAVARVIRRNSSGQGESSKNRKERKSVIPSILKNSTAMTYCDDRDHSVESSREGGEKRSLASEALRKEGHKGKSRSSCLWRKQKTGSKKPVIAKDQKFRRQVPVAGQKEGEQRQPFTEQPSISEIQRFELEKEKKKPPVDGNAISKWRPMNKVNSYRRRKQRGILGH